MILDRPWIVVDRKKDLQEICGNETQQHDRFKREMLRAIENEIQLVFLCEHGDGITCLEDVKKWVNPRLKISPNAMTGERLYNIMNRQIEKYGVRWEFCDKNHTGERILQILEERDV